MARTYLVFGDIEGKLDVLRVECYSTTKTTTVIGQHSCDATARYLPAQVSHWGRIEREQDYEQCEYEYVISAI